MASILVVEDDPQIQALLYNFLCADGHAVTPAGDGVEALARFQEGAFDLVLLDLLLPKIDGYGVCEVIRKSSAVPVIMLTALDSEEHQLRGYDLLVDDYITKPFSAKVLLRKVEAVLRRRAESCSATNRLTYLDVALDLDARAAYVRNEPVPLTQKEFDLLHQLLCARGRVLTRQILLEQVWRYDFLGDERVVDTHIKNLRRKLGVDYIQTIRGVGYRVDKADERQLDC